MDGILPPDARCKDLPINILKALFERRDHKFPEKTHKVIDEEISIMQGEIQLFKLGIKESE